MPEPPSGSIPFGYQRWTRLLFVNWAVDPAVLRNLVPPQFTLDLYKGKAYLSLVPFEVMSAQAIAELTVLTTR